MLILEPLDVIFVLDLLLMHVVSESFHPLLKELNLGVVLSVKLLGFGALHWLGCLGRPRGLWDHDRSNSSPGPCLCLHLLVMISNLSLSDRLISALLLASTLGCSPPLQGRLLCCFSLLGLFSSLHRLFLCLLPRPREFALSMSMSFAFHVCQRGEICLG